MSHISFYFWIIKRMDLCSNNTAQSRILKLLILAGNSFQNNFRHLRCVYFAALITSLLSNDTMVVLSRDDADKLHGKVNDSLSNITTLFAITSIECTIK